MPNIEWTAITTGYAMAALAYGFMLVMLLTHWKGRLQGGLLSLAVGLETLWALMRAFPPSSEWILRAAGSMEGLRYLGWQLFLVGLLHAQRAGREWFRLRNPRLLFFTVLAVALALYPFLPEGIRGLIPAAYVYGAFVVLAMGNLWFLETLFRNLHPDHRWGIKYMVIGLGGLFAYDLFLFANAVLFGQVDATLTSARGLINAVAVPLLAVAVVRNPDWSLDLFVSRRIVLHGTTFLVVGSWLILMGLAGYYIRRLGGDWGRVAQVTLLFLAGIGALAFVSSGQLRARLRVFLDKHFFNYRFDYREEWLRFTRTLSACGTGEEAGVCILRALAALVDSGGGTLWTRTEEGDYRPEAVWNRPRPDPDLWLESDAALPAFLARKGWVIDRDEWQARPAIYEDLPVPDWLREDERSWLIVPLPATDGLLGFVVLDRPRAPFEIDWEVRDLLKTAAAQAAVYLEQRRALEALAEARQFEGFHRLSTYILHDLKNIVAQQSLITRRAARHRDNPAFIDDALGVMAHSVDRMEQLMQLLQSGAMGSQHRVRIDLARLTREVIESLRDMRPHPRLESEVEEAIVESSLDRARAALRNLIRNAQQATPDEGEVVVRLSREGDWLKLEVADTGCGMDAEFIRHRLFKPFDTTKGDTGMGIGVYEVREWVRALGGELRVDSTPGKGTTFLLRLPLAGKEKGEQAEVCDAECA